MARVAALTLALALGACATKPAPPSVVCPTMQSLSPDWQKSLAAEIRDASATIRSTSVPP